MYKKFVLSNGMRVICEKMNSVRSVAVGVWVGAGSRYEDKENNGVSHFIEHMLFKGTRTRTAKQIAEEIDSIGGQINAFTSKDCTCFYTKTLDNHLDISLDILSDILLNAKLTKPDINIERNVILEEIRMCEDSYEDLAHDLLTETVWKGSPLGYSVLGTPESLGRVDKSVMRHYLSQKYIVENMVISVCGNFDEQDLVKKLERRFYKFKKNEEIGVPLPDNTKYLPGKILKRKEAEQMNLCLGFKGIEFGSDEKYALQLINSIFGGG